MGWTWGGCEVPTCSRGASNESYLFLCRRRRYCSRESLDLVKGADEISTFVVVRFEREGGFSRGIMQALLVYSVSLSLSSISNETSV